MRLQQNLLALFMLGLSAQCAAQNHYVIEYDRVNDELRYFQVFLDRGKLGQEVPVKHISVQEGDILQARMTNVNLLAFEATLDFEEVERPMSPLKGISKLFGGISSSQGILGSLGEIIDLSEADYGGLTRGAGDNATLDGQMANLLSEIQLDLSNAKAYHSVIAEELPATLRAPDMTKAEILEKLGDLESSVSSVDIGRIYDDIDTEISELNVLKSNAEIESATLMADADNVIEQWEALRFELDPESEADAIAEAAALLAEVEFEYTERFVVPEVDNYSPNLVMDFSFSTSDSEDSYADPTIYNHKMVSIKRKQPALRIVNGLVVNLPMTNSTSFELVQRNDSVSFISNEAKANLNFSTMVQYQFASEGGVSPSLNLGVSLPILNFTETSLQEGMRILTGAGLHFRSMPNLALTAGIAWGLNDVLTGQLAYNTPYNVYELEAQNIIDTGSWGDEVNLQPNFVTSKWSMAFSVGLSILVN